MVVKHRGLFSMEVEIPVRSYSDSQSQSQSQSKEKINLRELEEYLKLLKTEIKNWEYEFSENNEGRTPTAEDIRANKSVSSKYKRYQKYKAQFNVIKEKKAKANLERKEKSKELRRQERKELKRQHHHQEAQAHLDSQQAEFLEVEEENDVEVIPDEIGPTPQLHGRVLSIFDINVKVTPEKRQQNTPSKSRITQTVTVESPLSQTKVNSGTESNPTIQKVETPMKTRIIHTSVGDIDTNEFQTPTSKKVHRKLLFSPTKAESPVKQTPRRSRDRVLAPQLQETPKYLRSDSQSMNIGMLFDLSPEKSPENVKMAQTLETTETSSIPATPIKEFMTPRSSAMSPSKNIEPSPFLSLRNRGKSLFQMSQDLKEIVNLKAKWSQSEDEDIKKLIDQENKEFEAAEKKRLKLGELLGQEDVDETGETTEDPEGKADTAEQEVINERYRKKVKTNKRSTRRSKVTSSTNIDVEDPQSAMKIRGMIDKINHKRTRNDGESSDSDDSDRDGIGEDEDSDFELINVIHSEDEYEEEVSEDEEEREMRLKRRQEQIDYQKSDKFKKSNGLVSNNFVRMKIHHKNRGKKFRRR